MSANGFARDEVVTLDLGAVERAQESGYYAMPVGVLRDAAEVEREEGRVWRARTLDAIADQIEAQLKPEVYEHLSSQEGNQLHRALCGKLWQPQGRDKVTVVGKCPECARIAVEGWVA